MCEKWVVILRPKTTINILEYTIPNNFYKCNFFFLEKYVFHGKFDCIVNFERPIIHFFLCLYLSLFYY